MRLLFSLAAVALVSLGVFALEPVAPVLSLGVLYLFAVLPVAASSPCIAVTASGKRIRAL